jgi:hypothetical protein
VTEILYRLRIEGRRTSPGNPSLILQNYGGFYTKTRPVQNFTFDDTPGMYVGFDINVELAEELRAEINRSIDAHKRKLKLNTIVEYFVVMVEFMVGDEVFADTKMATAARSSLFSYRLAVDVSRQLKEFLEAKQLVTL